MVEVVDMGEKAPERMREAWTHAIRRIQKVLDENTKLSDVAIEQISEELDKVTRELARWFEGIMMEATPESSAVSRQQKIDAMLAKLQLLLSLQTIVRKEYEKKTGALVLEMNRFKEALAKIQETIKDAAHPSGQA